MSGIKPPVWKRPRTKVYDYNYNLGEHYYKPQINHIESRFNNRAVTPPRAKTFAERFAEDPVYGDNSGVHYRSTAERPFESSPAPPRRVSLQEDFGGSGAGGRRPLFESRGLSPDLDDIRPTLTRPRLNLGDRLLEAAGRRPGQGFGDDFGRGLTPDVDDPFDEAFFQRRKLLPPRSADAAFSSEDPFKRRFEALGASGADEEDFMSSAKKDTDSIVAGFRSRMKARKQRDEEASSSDFDTSGIESRVDRIRSRAKARLAELEDDLPALSLRDSSRGRALRDFDDFDSSGLSSTTGTSKTLRITKRTVKSTIETD